MTTNNGVQNIYVIEYMLLSADRKWTPLSLEQRFRDAKARIPKLPVPAQKWRISKFVRAT